MLWVLSGLNWLGYGLMLMAIFAGRNEPTLAPARSPRQSPDDDEETDLVPLQPAPSTRDSTGIQVR
jgi:hypothetical protein